MRMNVQVFLNFLKVFDIALFHRQMDAILTNNQHRVKLVLMLYR